MASNVWILRSLNTSVPGALANGALAYTANGDILYIGSNGNIVPIAGARTPGTLTANQALVTNATNMIDKIMMGNTIVNAVVNSLALTISNSTVTFSVIKPTAAQVSSADYYLASDSTWKQASSGKSAGDGLTSNATHIYVNPGNTQVVANSTGTWIDQTHIDHNSLSNFVANKHIDHTAVTMTAGVGLTGGGDISATRTISVSPGDGTIVANSTGTWVNTKDGLKANSTGLWVLAGTGVTVNSTGVHIGQAVATGSNPTFNDLTLTGNLVISGSLVNINVATLSVTDSLIKLANGNATTDVIDIGFYGVYGNSTVTTYTGLFRDASDGIYKLYDLSQTEPSTTVNIGATGYEPATLSANLSSANVSFTGGTISSGVNQTIDCGTF